MLFRSTLLLVTLDTTPPKTPTAFSATALSGQQVELAWTAPTDNVGVVQYTVYRDGAVRATPTATAFTDSGLDQATSNTHGVTALEAAGNEWAAAKRTVTTLDTIAPDPPQALTGTALSEKEVELTWQPAIDNVEIKKYHLFRDGVERKTTTETTFTDVFLTAGTEYTYAVTAEDTSQNESLPSAEVAVMTLDTTVPSVPSQLTAAAISLNQIDLTWNAATDNVGVVEYHVYRDGLLYAVTMETAFSDSEVTASTTYTYAVSAVDEAFNESELSASVEVSTTTSAFEFGKGIFVLNPRLRPVNDQILNHPHAAGVLLINSWSSIAIDEFAENNDWSYFIEEGSKVTEAGKELSLMISFIGTGVPRWVIDKGVQTVTITETNPFVSTFGEEFIAPVLWDPILVEEQVKFIENMGLLFSDDSNVKVINIQCVSTSGADWSPPRTVEENQAFLDAGYTNDLMFEACRQIIDAAFTTFPDKIISFAMGPLSEQLTGNPDKDAFAKDLIAYIKSNWPENAFYLARMNLHAQVPDPRLGDGLSTWDVMYTNAENTADNIRTSAQMVAAATDITSCRMNGKQFPCDAETNLSMAADLGVNVYGMRYLEIFAVDILAPELQDELAVIKQNIENME